MHGVYILTYHNELLASSTRKREFGCLGREGEIGCTVYYQQIPNFQLDPKCLVRFYWELLELCIFCLRAQG